MHVLFLKAMGKDMILKVVAYYLYLLRSLNEEIISFYSYIYFALFFSIQSEEVCWTLLAYYA